MQLRTLFEDDDAVSPVIGVILMVAITVILAAVIGTFVLGLGAGISSTAPSASFNFDWQDGGSEDVACPNSFGSDGVLDITHASGDKVPADQLTLSDGSSTNAWYECGNAGQNSEISAGAQADVSMDSDDTVRVLWQKDDDSATLGVWNGPDA